MVLYWNITESLNNDAVYENYFIRKLFMKKLLSEKNQITKQNYSMSISLLKQRSMWTAENLERYSLRF